MVGPANFEQLRFIALQRVLSPVEKLVELLVFETLLNEQNQRLILSVRKIESSLPGDESPAQTRRSLCLKKGPQKH